MRLTPPRPRDDDPFLSGRWGRELYSAYLRRKLNSGNYELVELRMTDKNYREFINEVSEMLQTRVVVERFLGIPIVVSDRVPPDTVVFVSAHDMQTHDFDEQFTCRRCSKTLEEIETQHLVLCPGREGNRTGETLSGVGR